MGDFPGIRTEISGKSHRSSVDLRKSVEVGSGSGLAGRSGVRLVYRLVNPTGVLVDNIDVTFNSALENSIFPLYFLF